MIQFKGIFGSVTFWEFAKSIRIQVFIDSRFLASDWLIQVKFQASIFA